MLENGKADIWNSFFTNLPRLNELVKPYALRSGISVESAILLTVYNEFPDINISVNEKLIEELEKRGLIKLADNKVIVTSKGAILSKAFIELRKANF